MMQYISEDQFDEVTIDQQQKFYDEIGVKPFHLTAPIIGQMIQFLYKFTTVLIESEERESPSMGWTVNHDHSSVELATALWEAVKPILKKL